LNLGVLIDLSVVPLRSSQVRQSEVSRTGVQTDT